MIVGYDLQHQGSPSTKMGSGVWGLAIIRNTQADGRRRACGLASQNRCENLRHRY